MTGKIVLVLATFALGRSVHGASRSTTAVALKVQAYKDGFRNCSRGMPPGITAAWQVSQKDVEKIDAALMLHMEKAGLTKKLRASPASYGRQYLGYVREERRFVYVNAFLRSFGDPRASYVRACDGGNLFWGIEYDVQAGTFANFEVNGELGDPLEGLKL